MMDSEYSHTTRETKTEYVVANNLETAQFLWNNRMGPNTAKTNISWNELGNVTIMIGNIYGV